VREDPPRLGGQELEQLILLGRQIYHGIAQADFLALVVNVQCPKLHIGRLGDAAHHRFDARLDLAQIKRLGDIIVRARREPADFVVGRIFRSHHDHWGLGAALAQLL